MTLDDLRRTVRGAVTTAHETGFVDAIQGNLWNRLIPDRAPQVVVRAANEDAVVAAVKFARANGLKVVVRGGGNNWCQPSLRSGGLMLDLRDLTTVLSIDVANRRAVIQPIISNRAIQKALNPRGLAYPTGHCPQVKATGPCRSASGAHQSAAAVQCRLLHRRSQYGRASGDRAAGFHA